jgi:hypothetical protein
MRKMQDLYKNVDGQGDCQMALDPKFRWQEGDPHTGFDLEPFRQHMEKVTGNSCQSPN